MEPDQKENQENTVSEKETTEAKNKLSSTLWDVVAFLVVVGLFELSWNNGIASLFYRLPKMNYSQATFIMAFLYILSRFTFTKSFNKEE
jgi:hypothetical protein